MIAIRYGDAETEAPLGCAHPPGLPTVGRPVPMGLRRYREATARAA